MITPKTKSAFEAFSKGKSQKVFQITSVLAKVWIKPILRRTFQAHVDIPCSVYLFSTGNYNDMPYTSNIIPY